MGVVHLSNLDDFHNTLRTNKLVVVDFYSDWCGPCRAMHPILDNLSTKHTDVKFVSINVDYPVFKELIQQFKINAIPTLIFFREQKEVSRHIGLTSVKVIDEWIEVCKYAGGSND